MFAFRYRDHDFLVTWSLLREAMQLVDDPQEKIVFLAAMSDALSFDSLMINIIVYLGEGQFEVSIPSNRWDGPAIKIGDDKAWCCVRYLGNQENTLIFLINFQPFLDWKLAG